MSPSPNRPGLALEGVSKSFGSFCAVNSVSVAFPAGQLTALTGPSGAGKTTLLRIAAGLLSPDAGRVGALPAGGPRPNTVLVFQDNLLFPHLRVIDNVMFAPLAKKVPRDSARQQALDLLEDVGLSAKARSWPGDLSAGQQQRVALARALAAQPDVLLLDEPFANLDRALRLETARFVRQLQRHHGLTVGLVSHGQEEVFTVADQVVLLQSGRVLQAGNPEQFRLHPVNLEAARFTGEVNVVVIEGMTQAFRAAETELVPQPDGDAVVSLVDWTGQGFRILVEWRGQKVAVLSTRKPPSTGERVRVVYSPLVFQETL